MPVQKQPPRVNVRYLTPTGEDSPDQAPYQLLSRVAAEFLNDLVEITVHFAFNSGLKPDSEGREILGMTRLQSDPARQMTGVDAVMILNQNWWVHPQTTDTQRLALIHHLACRIGFRRDDNQDLKRDELSRCLLYTRKPNIEEFKEVIEAHGLYVDELRQTYTIMASAEQNSSSEGFTEEVTEEVTEEA